MFICRFLSHHVTQGAIWVWLGKRLQELELMRVLFSWLFWLSASAAAAAAVLVTNSCMSNISTLRLVLFLILIATSCGMNFPHTLTLLCFFSIKCVSNSVLIAEKGKKKKSEKKLQFGWKSVDFCIFTVHIKKGFSYFSVTSIAVDVDSHHHAVELHMR